MHIAERGFFSQKSSLGSDSVWTDTDEVPGTPPTVGWVVVVVVVVVHFDPVQLVDFSVPTLGLGTPSVLSSDFPPVLVTVVPDAPGFTQIEYPLTVPGTVPGLHVPSGGAPSSPGG
jgi:hypothetical protein